MVFAVGHLFVHLLFVELGVGDLLDVADDAEGHGQVAAHVGQHHVDAGVFGGFVVHHDVVDGDAVFTDGDSLEAAAVEAKTFVLVLAEDHGLAMFEHDGAVVADSAVGDGGMGLVVEDDAVLEHLDHGASVVLGGARHALGGKLRDTVERAGEERALCAHHQLTRVEGIVDGAEGGSLGHLAELGGGAVLAFRQTVDLVVEDGDVEILVAADRVDEVVAADGHRVAVAHVDPHAQSWVGQLDAGGDGAGTTVDAVETVGVDIVGDTARASDAGDHADVFFLVAGLGEGGQQCG